MSLEISDRIDTSDRAIFDRSCALVIDVALRYGCDVMIRSRDHRGGRWTPHVKEGPRDCSISARYSTLFVTDDANADDILHELAHLILGKPSLFHSEAYVLMPFELALAEWIGEHLARRERREFLRYVRDYQARTVVFGNTTLDELVSPRKRKWWREGFDRAVKLGVIAHDGRPTFRCADWDASGLCPYVIPHLVDGALEWRCRDGARCRHGRREVDHDQDLVACDGN